jgi:uncharacterized protein involved in outer membrane biogenesis
MTGGAVMFGDFKFSPMSGTIELMNAKIAAERFVPPFLSIDRVEVKVAVARALKGEIVIRSLLIERPTMIINIHADGKTNLPSKSQAKEEAIVPKSGAAGGMWEINAEKIELTHGRLEFRDATRNNFKLTVEGINTTVTPQGQDLVVTLTADSVGRRDRPAELGVLKVLGKLVGGGFREPLSSALSLRASLADAIVFHVTSTLVANRCFDVDVEGPMSLVALMGLLPLSRAQTWAVEGKGDVDIRAKLSIELLKNIRIHEVELKASHFSVNRTFGNFGSDAPRKPGQPT